jgi:hypothetical protein
MIARDWHAARISVPTAKPLLARHHVTRLENAMIQKLLEGAKTDQEVRSIINVAFRTGHVTLRQAIGLCHSYGIDFEAK